MKTKYFKKIVGTFLVVLVSSIFATSFAQNDSGSGRNHDSQHKVLNQRDEERINNSIDRHHGEDRMSFLSGLLDRLTTLVGKIQNSDLSGPRKDRLLTLISEVIDVVQARIEELGGTSGQFPPIITDLKVSSVTDTSAMIGFTSDDSGTGYYVVLPSSMAIPSVSQVKAGQDAAGAAASLKGSFAMDAGMNTFSVSGLAPATSYQMYFVVNDPNGITIANVKALGFSTTGSGTGSGFLSQLSVSGMTNVGGSVSLQSSGIGTGYYVLLPSGSSAPSASQIKSGQNGSGSSAAFFGSFSLVSGGNSFSLSGLTGSTSYVLYVVATNGSGALQNVLSVPVTTTGGGGGGGGEGSLSITGFNVFPVTGTGGTLMFTSDGSGTGFYVILPSGSAAPSVAQIQAGQNSSGAAVELSGSFSIVNGGNSFDISGLTASTSYVIYFVGQNAAGNLMQDPMNLTFTTTAGGTVTTTVATFTEVRIMTGSMTAFVSSNEVGTGYYVVAPHVEGSTAPTPAQVKAGETSSGSTASMSGSFSLVNGGNSIQITGLTSFTHYDMYFASESSSGMSNSVTDIMFVTLPSNQ